MTFEIIMPFGGNCPHRLAARQWVSERYGDVSIREAPAPDGPWCKGAAVRTALADCGADIVAIADADVYTDGLRDAVAAVEGGVAWAIPHLHVHRLTAEATAGVLDGADWSDQPLEQQPPYPGIPGGGIVVAPREVVHSIPPDMRFTGWG